MPRADGFYHEALFYSGPEQFVAATAPAIRAAVGRDEPVMVMVDRAKIDQLHAVLGSGANGVHFSDMPTIGHNPARIIPAWSAFMDEHAHAGRPVHGIGEPVWAGRRLPELVECRHHEALLNVAFAEGPSFRLLCTYDSGALAPTVVASVRGTHPFVRRGDEIRATSDRDRVEAAGLFEEALPGAPADVDVLAFDGRSLAAVRRFVSRHAAPNLDGAALRDLVLAADELAVNSVRHGGGSGTLRIWLDDAHVVCEVTDRGHITNLLVGRRRPGPTDMGGRGLWMVNQLCDLVQIRSTAAGTVVRVHKRRP